MEIKKCRCCGKIWHLEELPDFKESNGLCYFTCLCESTLTVPVSLLEVLMDQTCIFLL